MANTLDSNPEMMQLGQPAFLLGYHDRAMKFPFLQAYVFIGVERHTGMSGRWYFQQAEAYLQNPITNLANANGDEVLSVDQEGLATFVDWIGLVAELAERLEDQRRR